MSRLDEIWDAYRRGEAEAERDGIFDNVVKDQSNRLTYATFSHFSDNPDKELAYMKGYGGEELEVCYECERIKENCECETTTNESYSEDESGDSSVGYSGGSSSALSYSGGSSSSSESGGCLVPIIVTVIVVGGFFVLSEMGRRRYEQMKPGGSYSGQQTAWTMREVNTTRLNVRSGPGAKSPVVAQFTQGSRLATSGESVNVGGDLWIKVSTDDGKIQGWANRKYLSP